VRLALAAPARGRDSWIVAPSVAVLSREHVQRWHATPTERPPLGDVVGRWRQWSNARQARLLIDATAGDVERMPTSSLERRRWRVALRERLQEFGQERLGWPDGYRRLLLGDAFFESAAAFTREARAFDEGLALADLGQALRNVWIGNSLQMLLGDPVEMCPGLFAYSMLYPATDNWLDDPTVTNLEKRSFNARFARRLAGESLEATRPPEPAAFQLVERIEGELPRRRYPAVYASLLAIQEAQSRSLLQHRGGTLSEAELLAVSVQKGGTSVLADLHLVAPTAGPSERRFAFGYGVFLQLLDDLQDVEQDLAAGQDTLVTRTAHQGALLDGFVGRLARFMDAVLDDERFFGPSSGQRIDLIRRNCRALLVGCVAESPHRFSRAFRRQLEAEWPLTLRAQRRLRRRLRKRASHVVSRLGEDGLANALAELAPSRDVAPARGPERVAAIGR
jgi:hypothetical protein